MRRVARFLLALALLVACPFLLLAAAVALAIADLLRVILPRRPLAPEVRPSAESATVVIPTWNALDLLERNLPFVVAALAAHPGNEIIVVDNASVDGTAQFLRSSFPTVKVITLPKNLGFGGGSNAGMRVAANDVVVLLNNDMCVEPGFLRPLLEGFSDEKVFSVSCQIFFADPAKRREETGLSHGWWEHGALRVRHCVDDGVRCLYPCFYGGGGSTAYDRRKFLELGGFDPLLAPFYLEDTDLGYMAWKRGWKVMYEPRSVVYHEHRGTIGKRFSEKEIRDVLATNFILWAWKNIHEWRRLSSHFFYTCSGAIISGLFGDSPERPTLQGLWRAFCRLSKAASSRSRARCLAVVSDTEAFRRPLGGYFRDRFEAMPAKPARLRVLFVSPYPVFPPIHGGAVFMYQTIRELARRCDLHLVVLLHYPQERAAHEHLRQVCASVEFIVKPSVQPATAASVLPHAIREFASQDLAWHIHRQILTCGIDLVQLEYTALAQYAADFRRLACVLFEHDIYFQSVARTWKHVPGLVGKLKAGLEYFRALHYETRVLSRLDRIQTCTRANLDHLLSTVPPLAGRLQTGLRAGIDASAYPYRANGREPFTMLFVGGFRHPPNLAALAWFVSKVLPAICSVHAEARLVVVGSDTPPPHMFQSLDHIELRGAVEDIREPLGRYAVFVCPVLSGSGVRVKLLESFASGIPTVSTHIGAEGLAERDGEFCALADDPARFAGKILSIFEDPAGAAAMAARARTEVETNWDIVRLTKRLEASYREVVWEKRGATSASP